MDTIWSPYGRLAFSKFTDENAETKSNGKKRYSCAFYLPKNREGFKSLDNAGMTDAMATKLLASIEEFKKTISDAIKTEAPKGVNINKIFKDGDAYADQKVSDWELENDDPAPDYLNATRNMYILQLATEFSPKLVGPKIAAGEITPDQVYDGCWVRMMIRGYGWAYQGKKGWSLGLGGTVQKWQDAATIGSGGGTTEAAGEDALELVPQMSDADVID